MFGKTRIDTCLSEAFRNNIEKYNVTVKNNRYIGIKQYEIFNVFFGSARIGI